MERSVNAAKPPVPARSRLAAGRCEPHAAPAPGIQAVLREAGQWHFADADDRHVRTMAIRGLETKSLRSTDDAVAVCLESGGEKNIGEETGGTQ